MTCLVTDWELCVLAQGAAATPSQVLVLATKWLPAPVPGTAALALEQQGEAPLDLMRLDVWYRVDVCLQSEVEFQAQGLAGVAELWLGDSLLARHDNMFVPLVCDLPACGDAQIWLCFRALGGQFPRRSGRARWRPRLIQPPSMRDVRQTVLGHMNGWCPEVLAVGPYLPLTLRPVEPLPWRCLSLQADWGPDGARLCVRLHLPPGLSARLICAGTDIPLCQQEDGTYLGAAQIARAHSWMPHTHGRPHRYCVTLVLQGQTFDLGEVGFRRIDIDTDQGGFRFVVNGLPIFCRGVCWTPPDLVGLSAAPEVYARQIGQLVAAGANMIRVGGTMVYEVDAFFEACDAAGVMVWHDFMLANFDYPSRDAHFMQSLEAEASHFLSRTRHHPCLALICGGSEVRQQAEMMGVEWPQVEPLYEGLLAEVCKFERPDVPFLPNSPWGGQPAFSTSQGVSHYYGVGAYMRPLEDARRASVRFTSECMALAHVPGQAELPATLAQQVGGWRWKQGVPRDAGAAWDFDDVRDHYVQRLYGVDPAALRYADSARYLDLGRAVSCDLAEALFSEWRRAGSTCAGALVWQWRDLFPGAGWGLLDQAGVAKPVLKALSRLWQPVHLGLTDEGLNGLSVHLVNETEQIMQGEITLEALRDGHHVIISGQKDVTLPARSQLSLTSGQIWGRFFDATCAYRFGPPGHEVTVASLRNADGQTLMAWACHLPERHLHRADLGLRYRIESSTSGLNLWVSTERFAQYLNFSSEGYFVDDDWVHLPPGVEHRIRLTPKPGVLQDAALAGGTLSALNSAQAIWVRLGSA